jgi:hypothetical protein
VRKPIYLPVVFHAFQIGGSDEQHSHYFGFRVGLSATSATVEVDNFVSHNEYFSVTVD